MDMFMLFLTYSFFHKFSTYKLEAISKHFKLYWYNSLKMINIKKKNEIPEKRRKDII